MVTESFLPSANGVTTSVLRVLDHLRARGHEALVVCPGPAPGSYAGFEVVEVPSVPVRGFPLGMPSPAVTAAVVGFDPDVVHAASPFGLGAHALAVARRRGVPSVAVFQTDVAAYAGTSRWPVAAGPAWRWLRTVHDLADLTLAPSSATLSTLRRNGFRRTALWGRGVRTDTFHPRHRTSPEGAALREELLEGRDVLVGFVGRLAPEKRVERLAQLGRLPRARVVVVGDGPSRPAVETALAGSGARFLGRRDGEDLARAYAALDVFVHTGTDETFGQTLQEAMASGVPVVAPASGGPLDVVDHGRTGLLHPPHDLRALACAVEHLVGAPQVRRAMGEAGRRTALTRSWDVVCDRLLDHYATVAVRHAADGPEVDAVLVR